MVSPKAIQIALDEIFAKHVDIGFIAQGSLTDQASASSSLPYLESELGINVLSVALCLEQFARKFEEQGFGSLGVIGSVAGDRGRAYNYSYGATKAFVEKFVEGLQQRFATTEISVTLIKPGPTATPMTSKHLGRMSSPEGVAEDIVSAIQNRDQKIYTPRLWKYIMLIVKLIPFFIFKRLSF
jgi:short-subunit dehydrogenase